MADWDASVTEWTEYFEGRNWADENLPRLVELYTSSDLSTGTLRTRLFEEAARAYPRQRDSMDNDLRQTAWVAGATRRLVETMPRTMEAAAAVFDASMDMGMIIGAEIGTWQALEALKKKSASWWRKKKGDAAPNDVLAVLAAEFRRRQKRSPASKWELLIETLGTREMRAMETLESITLRQDGEYWSFEVDGADNWSFQVMARPVFQDGRVIQGAGEIVG